MRSLTVKAASGALSPSNPKVKSNSVNFPTHVPKHSSISSSSESASSRERFRPPLLFEVVRPTDGAVDTDGNGDGATPAIAAERLGDERCNSLGYRRGEKAGFGETEDMDTNSVKST